MLGMASHRHPLHGPPYQGVQLGVDRYEVAGPLAQHVGSAKVKDCSSSTAGETAVSPKSPLWYSGQPSGAGTEVGGRGIRGGAAPDKVTSSLLARTISCCNKLTAEATALLSGFVDCAIDMGVDYKARSLSSGDVGGAGPLCQSAVCEPRSLDSRVPGNAAYGLKRDQDAENDIEYFKREKTKDPRALYLRSVYLGRNGNDAGARAALQEITQLLDPVPRARLKNQLQGLLLIGGLAHYGLGELEQAREYFSEYMTIDPNHLGARKLLGSVLIAQGNAVEAINVLEVREGGNRRSTVLALLATAHG